MNKEEPYRDQAERLKRRIEKINEQTVESDLLPPREQVHRQKKKKTKIKIKYPVIRLLVLFFILLPIIYFSVISYLDGKKLNRAEKTSGNSVGYETINIEKQKIDNHSDKKEENKGANPDSSPTTENTNTTETTTTDQKTNNVQEKNDKIEQPVQTKSTNQSTNTTSNNQNSTTGGSVQTNPTPQPAVTSTKFIYHTVKPQETLYRIAITYYHSDDGVNIIKQANHLKSEQITEGQVLKIPMKN